MLLTHVNSKSKEAKYNGCILTGNAGRAWHESYAVFLTLITGLNRGFG
jgi:hypothetical protein